MGLGSFRNFCAFAEQAGLRGCYVARALEGRVGGYAEESWSIPENSLHHELARALVKWRIFRWNWLVTAFTGGADRERARTK